MKTSRKTLSMLLTAILIFTMIPLSAFAQGDMSENGEGGVGVATPAVTALATENDTLIYNLGKREITVTDFNEDGSYTIQLEDNAFFPYEVQFNHDGQTSVKTFDTRDSTVSVGGHVISVTSNYDEDAISHIGVYIDGEYIAATPEKKTFTNSMIAPRSILPLTRQNLTLNLRDLTPEQTKSVQVSARTPISTNISGKTVLWNYKGASTTTNQDSNDVDSYSALPSGAVDMSRVNGFTMLVGSGNQLDASNVRYMVNVQRNTTPSISLYLHAQDGQGDRNEIGYTSSYRTQNNVRNYPMYIPKSFPVNAEYFLNLNDSFSSYPDTKVYTGLYDTPEQAAANGTDITAQILEDEWTIDSGYKADFSTAKEFTLVCKMGAELVMLQKFTVQAVSDDGESYYIGYNGLYESGLDQYGDRIRAHSSTSYSYDELSDVETVYVTLSSGNIADRNYYTYFDCYDPVAGDYDNSKVTKAVLGHYNSLAAAASQADIKGQLIKTYTEMNSTAGAGYSANFKNGVKFTIFVGDDVYKFTVVAVENQGSDDTYLNITGADGVDSGDVYKILSRHDSVSSQFGNQVLLVNDQTANFSALKPTFTTAQGLVAYVGETAVQTSSVNAHDFSNNQAVQYTVRSESNNFRKNYWVSFVKAVNGAAKLYAVVDGQEPGKREVFFDPGTDNRHDVFIANIGDQALTGLSVTIENPVNIALDNYWTVGGSGNDTLAGFTDAGANAYGELDNIAKIRLVPMGLGAVSGTLVISSTNGGEIRITLTGEATEPKITTEQTAFDSNKAVKYVPYAFMIRTNNKYDWNRETFSLYSGDLPDGMMIRPSGELYGVPKETGTFTFTVRVQYSDSRFAASTATFTLTVLDNTNENVASAWDYNITNFVAGSHGGTMTSYSAWTFRTEGSYDDFVGFWLDGKKLTEGVDYDSEPGSTVITVRAQTFQNAGPGKHTISAEFRQNKDENRELTRSPQNYNANPTNPGGGGGSGGGSSGGNPGGNRNNNTPSSPPINPVAVAQTEAQAADKSLPKLIVKLRGVDLVSLKDLKEIAAIAKKENKTPWLNVDSMSEDGRSVDVRVSINPALAKNSMNLAGSTYSPRAQMAKKLFEKFFKNELAAVISLMQRGDFGQPAEICVKVPEGTNIEELVFYSYNPETNSYRQIKDPNAWIDQKGYLHFTTAYANEIIISNGKLEQK